MNDYQAKLLGMADPIKSNIFPKPYKKPATNITLVLIHYKDFNL